MLRAALFQRKSRSGWLEELDGIREDALQEHEGGVANVVDAEDIWTDLRDGGEYEDPHEISSLYATDATPDLPVTKPAARNGKSKPKSAPVAAEAPAPPQPQVAAPAPPPPPPAPPVEAPAAVIDEAWPPAVDPILPTSSQYDDQIWVQPAPHPIRPSEMWHPAELAPVPLGEESFEPIPEERVASADLMDPTYNPRLDPARSAPAPDPVLAPAPAADQRTTSQLESELIDRADPALIEPIESAGNLVNGPVGRRVRRDRPVERPKASLPPRDAHQPLADRGEQSPLPTAPLPPAALPTRSHRLPGLELPATPSSVVPPRPAAAPAPEAVAAPAPVAPAPAPVVAEPVAAPAPVAPAPAPAPVAEAPAPAPAPAPETPAPTPIAIAEDGLVDAPGTIVRIGGERRARALGTPSGVVVALDEGWCWASPGEGAAAALRIVLPAATLTVDPGATALAVVEADGSVFVVVAAGSAHLDRGGDGAAVARGTIVMLDPSGAAQMDAATDAEIEADPIVAENLVLDAEL